jgi:hypothetical protein
MPIPPLAGRLAGALQDTVKAADAIHQANLEAAKQAEPTPPAPAPSPEPVTPERKS